MNKIYIPNTTGLKISQQQRLDELRIIIAWKCKKLTYNHKILNVHCQNQRYHPSS